jgi:hypothetical protein
MFSTALATMKFLSETRPWIGFSSRLGTAYLGATLRPILVTKNREIIQVSKSSSHSLISRSSDLSRLTLSQLRIIIEDCSQLSDTTAIFEWLIPFYFWCLSQRFRLCTKMTALLTFFFVNQNGVSGSPLSENGDIRSECALSSTHGTTVSSVGVSTSLQVKLAGEVRAHGFGRGLEAESGGRGSKVRRELRSISLLPIGHVLLLRDQVVNTLVHFYHL